MVSLPSTEKYNQKYYQYPPQPFYNAPYYHQQHSGIIHYTQYDKRVHSLSNNAVEHQSYYNQFNNGINQRGNFVNQVHRSPNDPTFPSNSKNTSITSINNQEQSKQTIPENTGASSQKPSHSIREQPVSQNKLENLSGDVEFINFLENSFARIKNVIESPSCVISCKSAEQCYEKYQVSLSDIICFNNQSYVTAVQTNFLLLETNYYRSSNKLYIFHQHPPHRNKVGLFLIFYLL